MTRFERAYLLIQPAMPPLHKIVRKRLRRYARGAPATRILDVGGRKSQCTIGVPARVTVTDIPRETEVQEALHLGITPKIVTEVMARRSNIEEVLIDDMTRSALPSDSFDVVVAVEVLEHVHEDEAFVQNVHRVLKPGGVFLMTTPNGDSVPNTNPDHKRHYRREELRAVLSSSFSEPTIEYAIRSGRARRWSLNSWSPRKPFRTMVSMFGSVVNTFQSRPGRLEESVDSTRHLIAEMRKAR